MMKMLIKCQQQTFEELTYNVDTIVDTQIAMLVEPDVSALSDLQGDYSIDMGAYKKQIGCVMLQKQSERTDCPDWILVSIVILHHQSK